MLLVLVVVISDLGALEMLDKLDKGYDESEFDEFKTDQSFSFCFTSILDI